MGNIQFINAGAGSGKTYTLTKMLCESLSKGAKPSEFVLTTYTKAAADEFRNKIKSRLIEEGMSEVLPLVESAHIGTIHSVAQSYIEKYWYLLDMSPALSVKEEDEMKTFRSHALETAASEDDLSFFYNYATMLDIKKNEGTTSKPNPDFWKDLVIDLVDKLRLYGFESEHLESFKQSSIEVVKDVYPAYTMKMDELKNVAGDLQMYINNLKGNSKTAALKVWAEAFAPFIEEPAWEKSLPILKAIEKSPVWVQKAPEDMFDMVKKYALSCVREKTLECVERVFAIAARLLDNISEYKRAEGILEFSDLEVLFLELLSNDSVITDLSESIKYVFVDEFQDVSPIQLKIFQTLGEIVGESCWVGDPKQAIYGFRGSDSSLVNSVITSMKENVKKLEFSHRSLPQLVNASNEMFINSFALLTDSEKLEGKYVKLDPCEKKIAEEAAYKGAYIAQRHWWLSIPTNEGQNAKTTNASKVYPALATKLWNIFKEQKFKVTDTIGDKPVVRNLKYGDVAILTRNNSDCIKIADALRAKGLPVSVLDDKLANQTEVKLVIALMKYIAGIDKKLTVAELRRLMLDENLETILLALAKQNECAGLMQLIDVLKEKYRYHSVYDMVKELIATLDLRHLVCKWTMGQKRQTNLDVLVFMAASFVKRKKEASVQEFIYYIDDRKIEVPFDNTGNTIKVLTYHKSKGLQWKMVILNSLHDDSLDEGDFFKKEFSKITIRTKPDGQVCFNLFPPVVAVEKLVINRIQQAEKAHELWDFLKEKKRAEDLRLLYVGFTRAENYLISLSFGAVPSKWLENTRVTFNASVSKEEICDDSTLDVSGSQTVNVLPYDNVLTKVEGQKKYISPSQCEADPQAGVPTCELETIAGNIDVARWSIDADVFGTCIHNYMAVHRWSSEEKYGETNVKNAGRVIDGFGLSGLVAAENLVKQADAFFAYVEKKYGKIETTVHEVPFIRRRNGQVITGEIDLYVRTASGEGILVDFKNPMIRKETDEAALKDKAIKYWPQLEAYRDALCESGHPVNHIYIYYPMIGIAAKIIK